MSNDDEFRMVVGVVLAQLDEAFPEETKIDEKKAAESCGVEVKKNIDQNRADFYEIFPDAAYSYGDFPSGRKFISILWSTLKWLRDEGMIRAEGDCATESIVLTSKAKDALGKPSSHGGQIGDTMTHAAREISVGENKSKLTTSVGEFIGSFVKGAFFS